MQEQNVILIMKSIWYHKGKTELTQVSINKIKAGSNSNHSQWNSLSGEKKKKMFSVAWEILKYLALLLQKN